MSTAASIDSAQAAPGPAMRRGGGAARIEPGSPATGTPDPHLVAEMKQEIRVLVQEIAELAAGDLSPEEFYSGFLARVVSAMAAVGGAIWITGESGKLKLACQVNLAQTGVERTPQDRTRHGLLLKNVMSGAQAVIAPPASGTAAAEAGNPTEHSLVLAPLVVERKSEAVVEIFQRAGGGPSTQRGYLRFLVQMCDVACDYLKNQRLRQLASSQSLWQQIEQFTQALHRSLDVEATAYTVVNEGRRLIGCDRVSVALAYGSRCRVEAVSGLDSIDRRASEVRRLAKLAEAVLRTREPLWSQAGQEDLPEQIDEPLQAYVDQAHSRLVAVLPLVKPTDGEPASAPIGALIVEQLREAKVGDSLRSRSELAAQHASAALANAIEHSSLPLLSLWKAAGQATWLLRGRALPKTLLAVGLLIFGIAALALVPTDFEVAARGKLQPAERREVFAPLDGVVAQVAVRHGELVEAGSILAELTNTDLELQLASLIGRQTTNAERLAALQRALLDTRNGMSRLTAAEENRLAGEMLELRQEAESIERELALVRQKQQQLTIVAPQRGQVVTWKVEDLLLHRPVQRGQGLLTLANPDGPWELELYLPERRIKHVQAQSQLDATFALASHPGQTFRGRVVEIEQSAEVRGDEGNTVLVRVAVEKEELPPLFDQTTVT
ncbi:MAG TPA: HlyD family efflux transporter periplasmic adaptor subunit, partial [Pirellulaceae bacterium]|nr:HlyD family efflux transporter periplasmic adaptor subunit [Pirellulaceae bacterium]